MVLPAVQAKGLWTSISLNPGACPNRSTLDSTGSPSTTGPFIFGQRSQLASYRGCFRREGSVFGMLGS